MLRVVAFAALAMLMTFPHPTSLTTKVPGDGGDSLFLVWTMRWVEHALPQGWSALWNAPMFHPAKHTLAYSDALLPLAPLFGLLRWITRSPALAFNLLSLAAWTISLWATDRLARRLGCSAGPAFVAAVVFTFSTMRLAQYRHLQLVMGALIPVCLLALLRLLERPSLKRGVAFGAYTALVTLLASYYGVLVLLATAVIVLVHGATRRPEPRRPLARSLAAAGLVFAVAVLPVGYQYARLQRDSHFRRSPDPTFNAHWSDFRAVSVDNHFVKHRWPLNDAGFTKTGENWLFPGYVATVLALSGIVLLVRRRARDSIPPSRRHELWLLATAGVVLLVLAFGSPMHVGGRDIPLPFGLVRELLPGASAMRVPARLTVLPMLVVALLAGVGLHLALRRTGRVAAVLVCALLTGIVLLETSIRIETVKVSPVEAAVAVNHALDRRPEGVVLELPITSLQSGPVWGFVETPRQLAATIDWNPRVNGYSGFQPKGYDELVATLNRFPDDEVWPVLDRLDVRYVILRTSIPYDIGRERRAAYQRPGIGVLDDAQAQAIIDFVPAGRLTRVDHIGDAYLLQLKGSRRAG